MSHFICSACGTQFPASAEAPESCPICTDARQYIPPSGQQWTTPEKLRGTHRNAFEQCEPNLIGIATTPDFAIGERALLLRTAHGNFVWDCVTLLDGATMEIIRAFGGLRGIAISHPHYYTTMVEWSRAFDDAPIYLHAADREWVMRSDRAIDFWEGEQKELAPGVTLIRCGGHFAGGTVLHWAEGASGRGALLTGDILRVTPDGWVSFMYSYPNYIPLGASAVAGITDVLKPLAYDRIYGAFSGRVILEEAKATVAKSAERYVRAIRGWDPALSQANHNALSRRGSKRRAAGSIDLRRLPRREHDTDRRFREIDRACCLRMHGQLFCGGAREFRTEVPEERVPAWLDEPHHAVADQKESTELDETTRSHLACHAAVIAWAEEISNGC